MSNAPPINEAVPKPSHYFVVHKAKKNVPDKSPCVKLNKIWKIKSKAKSVRKTKEAKTKVGKKDNLMHQCKHCDRVFEKSVSLGGHLSKVHPGLSKSYSHKMEVRGKREEQRKYLLLAKEWFVENVGGNLK